MDKIEQLFEEMICPMCYRLNPQHASMDNGEGCHTCEDKERYCASNQPLDTSELLTDEEIDHITLTDDDIAELEQTASIGLSPKDHIQYKQSFEWLCNSRLKEKTGKAQLSKCQKRIDELLKINEEHRILNGQLREEITQKDREIECRKAKSNGVITR